MNTKCLTPGCEKVLEEYGLGRTVRGLCRRCYSAALRLVHKKITTWEELMATGLAGPVKHNARIKKESLLEKALRQKRAEAQE